MAILALLLTSCAARDGLAFSYVGSDEGFAQASAAALEWRMTCGVDLTVARGGDDIPLEEVEPGSLARPGLIVYGTTTLRGDTGKVRHVRFTRGERGYETTLHEFGHALGIEAHLDHGIMQPMATRTVAEVRVTEADCAELP